MDRRSFIESCTAGRGLHRPPRRPCRPSGADAKPRRYERVVLVDDHGSALKASNLKPLTNYVFHYPYEATPVFLLDLGKPALPQALSTRTQDSYAWPGGVGLQAQRRRLFGDLPAPARVPDAGRSFISFRRDARAAGRAGRVDPLLRRPQPVRPARGSQVMSGPAQQPLLAVLLEHDAKTDTLAAWGTLGGELFDDFFRKYEMKLSLEIGPTAKRMVTGQGNGQGAGEVLQELHPVLSG
jgi:hypothetical protein